MNRFEKMTYKEFLEETRTKGYPFAEKYPEEYRTEEFYLIAVEHTGNIIGCVPEKSRTGKICLAAIKKHSYAIYYVPEEKITAEMFWIAMKNIDSDQVPIGYRKADYKWEPTKYVKKPPNLLPEEFLKVPLDFHIRGMKDMSLEDYEAFLLRNKSVEELLTHRLAWFQEQGKRLLTIQLLESKESL